MVVCVEVATPYSHAESAVVVPDDICEIVAPMPPMYPADHLAVARFTRAHAIINSNVPVVENVGEVHFALFVTVVPTVVSVTVSRLVLENTDTTID